jgi:hypothetical protein
MSFTLLIFNRKQSFVESEAIPQSGIGSVRAFCYRDGDSDLAFEDDFFLGMCWGGQSER